MSRCSYRLVAVTPALSLLFALAAPVPVRAGAEDPTIPIAARAGGRVVHHSVEWGQTIWSISLRYGSTVEAVVRANAIADVRRVPVGARLAIPVPGDPEPLAADSRLPPVSLPLPGGLTGADGPAAASGAPAGVDRLLERGEAQLHEARFEAALSSAGAARALLEGLDPVDVAGRQVRLEVLTATAQVALGQTDLAQVSLVRALREDPGLEFDPQETSPKVMEVFYTARRVASRSR